jgi:protein-arginine kinase activator protein McsA
MARVEWEATLNRLLNDMVNYEDYEKCAEIQKYLKALKPQKKTE